MPDKFRIILMDGKVSKELFELIRPSDNKNRIVVESESNARLTIHKRRTLSVDSYGKAVAMQRGSVIKAVCPECSKVYEVVDDKIACTEHGEFETTSHDQKSQSVNMIRRSRPPKKDKKENNPMVTEATAVNAPEAVNTPEAASTPIAVVDLEEIKKHGVELWTKPQLHFDHAKMDVRAHVLLADDPIRKLCFNTYDGTLGKKKVLKDLHLAEFQASTPVQGKKLWHEPKGTLDDARQHLEKKGYTKG